VKQTQKPSNASSPHSKTDELWDSLFSELEPLDAERQRTFTTYRFNPTAYIESQLGWTPWVGDDEHPGQQEIIDAYTLALQQMHERRDYEAGKIERHELRYWQPGQVIKNWLRVEAGHTVGKTKLSSGIFSHFFDCFPSIIYTFAPSKEQIKDLLWKEIGDDRTAAGLPGRILETCEIRLSASHFAKGKATNDDGGKGTERVHGQHNAYLLFIIDEAEGVPDFVFSAIRSMTSGGICIVLMLANPRTRISTFHKIKSQSNVANFRISCLYHPNVIADREVVPKAVRREYITEVMREHYERTDHHDPDAHTFELPWQPGVIYRPDTEFLFRVLGIAPANVADDTLIPVGRYEAACRREPSDQNAHLARMGVDVSRFGKDYGTLYIWHNGCVWRAGQFWKQDTIDYFQKVKAEALELAAQGVTSLHIRIDGGGGFGGNVVDLLRADADLQNAFEEYVVLEVHFNGVPYNAAAYADLITEMYAEAAETLKGIAVIDAPGALEADLCERKYDWKNVKGIWVKELVSKKLFKKAHHRSPDDGDGCVLALAPDFLFADPTPTTHVATPMITGARRRGKR
jgi:hypothetical protein